MIPTPARRDVLFKAFSQALFERDMEALYGVVTPDFQWSYHDGISMTKSLAGAGPITEHLVGQKALFSSQRYHEIAYHHLPEMTFMTMRVSETVRATGAQREQRGVECYTFKDGKIATKDVYHAAIRLATASLLLPAGSEIVEAREHGRARIAWPLASWGAPRFGLSAVGTSDAAGGATCPSRRARHYINT